MGFLQRNSNTASAHNLLVQAQYYDENTRSVKCTRETRGSWVRFFLLADSELYSSGFCTD